MKRIVFMGTPDFAVPVLQQIISDQYEVVLVVTQPDRPKGRKRVLTPPPVKEEALKHNIPVFQPEKIRAEFEHVLNYKPDIIVTAAFGQILPKELLEAPAYGCINVHASLLPELRGGAPIHYAILQGKKETGITIMYMVEKLDAGDIITQKRVTIEEEAHVGTLHDKLAEAGASLLKDTLPTLFNQKATRTKQEDSQATFASNIKREQEKIDWTKSHVEIYNHIRGLHPWPVAFTTLQGKTLKVWWGIKENIHFAANPGEIVRIEDDGFVVCCGDNKGIKITSLQPSGKKRMTASDFLRGTGNEILLGEKLGE
ncbi:methionyl-tRNA formyltransferase [Aquibacillus koreensis]|uniref:Methionyl-tRNA formyltransferase n=1 Tax=Aquibacillus koreensis TaxID=279446 RepID=A0A9X3WNE0_9BACI|nr:methionyl-tRNA formyltransferase [Aquibacillus koreensis]MCT2538018.1 methionyl-tRNA formyltransferase [Aquibacillus koreensis]MDC3420541.1 methionyl-tRNA formyltransferase [Aquibacillus koreensis]